MRASLILAIALAIQARPWAPAAKAQSPAPTSRSATGAVLPAARVDYPSAPAGPQGAGVPPDQAAGTTRGNCVDCHAKSSAVLVTAWQQSRHADKQVGCADCHGDNHSKIFEVKGEVSAAVCGSCHSKQVAEFGLSLHAVAVEQMQTDPRFHHLSPAVADLSCNNCHQIGARSSDGSRGRCNSCHSSHSFSVAEARRPEACAVCHTGPDHAQLEMWQTSRHGQLFAAAETRAQAPTCVTCHMAGGNHNTGVGLTLGNIANGATLESSNAPVQMRSITVESAETQRGVMIKACLPCHTSRFASENLAKADQMKLEADALLGEAAKTIAGLKRDGFLLNGVPKSPGAQSYEHRLGTPELVQEELSDRGRSIPPHPSLSPRRSSAFAEIAPGEGDPAHAGPGEGSFSSHEKSGVPSSDERLNLARSDPDFEGPSLIEQRYFDMVKFHHASTFKGAYHQSPMHAHNLGYSRLKQDLNFIRSEAAKMRSRDSKRQP